ncbi:histidine N-alpha-methyltransferase-like [Ylistrum balloti]|uniref:histidine N-alpha-methyltransferase-like n=1 Tax=Ylistrum balloti TaxID=509963 RepID=UPI00290581B3|nr:histidine N-alpha-methyltransferase-like [Ylistrum balloti]
MDTKDALRAGLRSTPKYLPVWYRYDKAGSVYNDRCLMENTFYYFYKSEISILANNIKEIIPDLAEAPHLVDMGSGNSEKTRGFIDALLQKHGHIQYLPVDISEEFLSSVSDQISEIYGSKLTIKSVPGDYDIGIEKLSGMPGIKLITWLGGGFQNQSYEDQVRRLKLLSNVMTEECRLIISLDITDDKEQIENAYLDPTGISADLYRNAINRLNREYGSSINTATLVLEAEYIHNDRPEETSYVTLCGVSQEKRTHDIPGLGITINLEKDERFYLHEGKGLSCKYSIKQIQTLGLCGGLHLEHYWTDTSNHVAVCCFSTKKNS